MKAYSIVENEYAYDSCIHRTNSNRIGRTLVQNREKQSLKTPIVVFFLLIEKTKIA